LFIFMEQRRSIGHQNWNFWENVIKWL